MPAKADEDHPLLDHPLTPALLSAIFRWMRCDSADGCDAAEALAEVRRIAADMMPR